MRLKLKSRSLAITSQQRSKVRLPSGVDAVIKLNLTGPKTLGPLIRRKAERERTALRILQGLAVPKLFEVEKHKFVEAETAFECVAIEWVPWKGCRERKFSVYRASGIWLFVLEQLCAFRRRGILYTDIKPDHILLKDDLSQARIIDFDFATATLDNGVYLHSDIGLTLPYMAPECSYLEWTPESSLVYTATLLFAALLKMDMNNFKYHSAQGKSLKRKLVKKGHSKILRLLEKGLSHSPENRPANYEALFSQAINTIKFPPSLRIWKKLREPYLEELRELGLEK